MIRNVAVITFILIWIPFSSDSSINIEKTISNEVVEIERKIHVEVQRQISCLARNIYYEAGFESDEGKLAVATVTMNRVEHKHFPQTVCDVVYQKNSRGCQFSWTCGSKAKFNQRAYDRSYRIAEKVLTDSIKIKRLSKALYFHNTTIDPNWEFAEPIEQIGNHIFYEPKRKQPIT
jgi:spore germination cell wall hydrolase CwlJ-like protein